MFWPFPIPLERGFQMLHRFRDSLIVLVSAFTLTSLATAQNERQQQPPAAKEQKTGAPPADKRAPPPPPHDIREPGDPANGPSDGIQADGVKAMPNDGKPQHQLPYTPYGEQAYKSHHALEGADAVLPGPFN